MSGGLDLIMILEWKRGKCMAGVNNSMKFRTTRGTQEILAMPCDIYSGS
jgi:hypothetical protein